MRVESIGRRAARAALEILGGKKPSQITEARNRRRRVYLNPTLARKIGFTPGPELAGAKTVE